MAQVNLSQAVQYFPLKDDLISTTADVVNVRLNAACFSCSSQEFVPLVDRNYKIMPVKYGHN